MDALVQFSLAFTRVLQSLSPALDGMMLTFSFLGSTEFYLIVIPLVYWNVSSGVAIRALMVLLASEYAVSATKQIFRQPRPYWNSDVSAISEEPTYGLPSGHAANSYSFWGFLSSRLRARWFSWLAMFLILMVALSRIYLGVHYVHDVLGGWLLGALILIAFNKYEKQLSTFFNSKPLGTQVALAFGISLAMVVAAFAMSTAFAGTLEPVEWADFASEAHSPETSVSLAGTLFGGLLGYTLMKRSGKFSSQGSMNRKVTRYLLGVIGVVAIFFGLDVLFAALTPDMTLLGYTLRYFRYGVVALWVTFGYPWLARKAGLFTQ